LFFKSSIGIDISANRVCAVYLKGDFKGGNLVSESSCLLDASKSRQERLSDISAFINGFIQETKTAAPDVFIGIPSDQAMFREIEFPLAVKENLTTTLFYEIEKYIPFTAEDIYFDYQIIAEDKTSEKLTLVLSAVKKEILEDYLKIAENIPQGVSGIEIAAAGAVNYHFYGHPETKGPLVLVSERESRVDAMMVRDRALVYAKSFRGAGEAIDALAPGGRLLELQASFFEGEKAGQLVLYGVSDAENWRRRLSPEFQTISSGDLCEGLTDPASIPAFGLALKGIRPVPVQMNLMPPALRKKPNRTAFYVMMALALLIIVSGVLWITSLWMNQRQLMNDLDAESARLKTEVSVVEKMAEENRKIRENLAYLRSIRPGNAYLIEIINELSAIMPQTAYITDFKLNGNKLGLYGMADSASELIPILEESPLFMDVAFLSAIRNSRDGKEIFRIGCNLQTKK